MIEAIRPIILEQTGASEILDVQLIQELWSGYGELNRVLLDNGPVILKLINLFNPPQSTNIGHSRKKNSYKVETTWYQNYNSSIEGAILPKHIGSGHTEKHQYLILEDLKSKSFYPRSKVNWSEVKNCLNWLAHFHRTFLGTRPQGLWPIGTYWHLETRPEELEVLTDFELKEAAPLIDAKLNQAKFKTIVHGDAKLANFLFTKDTAAAVDFQYVGGGVGVKDVAYFLSSVYREEELEKLESQCLDYYFDVLDHPEVEIEWRELYSYAWCDFYRFLQGWSPGHWKLNSYSEKMKNKVLKCL
ncbi:MAG: ecdysteroid 22-kinase family protein [Bacteriovoracaceae bacterium]|nr:ecdysteroid 22-kinase family protein [Bacteriovoracaceae bacterium]